MFDLDLCFSGHSSKGHLDDHLGTAEFGPTGSIPVRGMQAGSLQGPFVVYSHRPPGGASTGSNLLGAVQTQPARSLFGGRKEGNVLFNNALNTFYLWLYGVRHMVEDRSDSEKGNPLPPHGLLFLISNKGSFICIIPQTG